MGNRKARRAAGKTMPEGECLVQVGAVICDIDGTLLPAGRSAISARTRLTLLALKNAGVRVVLATGRAPQVALAAAEKYPMMRWCARRAQPCWRRAAGPAPCTR